MAANLEGHLSTSSSQGVDELCSTRAGSSTLSKTKNKFALSHQELQKRRHAKILESKIEKKYKSKMKRVVNFFFQSSQKENMTSDLVTSLDEKVSSFESVLLPRTKKERKLNAEIQSSAEDSDDRRFKMKHIQKSEVEFVGPLCHRTKFADEVESKTEKSDNNKNVPQRHIAPLTVKKLFGFDAGIFAKNLTTDTRNKILIVSGNLISLYDFEYDTHEILPLHRNKIVSTSVDSMGNFFVTSDMGPESRIIIWDAVRSFPIHSIKNFNGNGCPYVKLSPCAKYLLTVVEKHESKEVKLVSLWEWTYRKENPDVTIEVDIAIYGCLKKIDFNFDICHYLILTTESQVIFLTYKGDSSTETQSDNYSQSSSQNSECLKNNKEKKAIFRKYGLKKKDVKELVNYVKEVCDNQKEQNMTNEETVRNENDKENRTTSKVLSFYEPKDIHKIRHGGTYLDSAYVRGTRMAITGTSNGNVIVWSDVGLKTGCFFDPEPLLPQLSNNKNFLLQIHLDLHPIELIYNIDRYIVTVNSKGQISFYNNKLIPVYKIEDFGTDSPVNISFNLRQKSPEHAMTLREYQDAEEKHFWAKKSSQANKVLIKQGLSSKSNMSEDKLCKKNSYNDFVFDATKNVKRRKVENWKKAQNLVYCINNSKQLFDVRDFIMTTNHGDIIYVNVTHNTVYEILSNSYNEPTSIDTHPRYNYLCVGTRCGNIFLVDYSTSAIINDNRLDISKQIFEENLLLDENIMATMYNIVSLKYSPDGNIIGCGVEYGDVWLLDGSTWIWLKRIGRSEVPIMKIIFSRLSDFLAFYDYDSHIILYKMDKEPQYSGKIRAHFKPMTDLIFFSLNNTLRMFSIGEDCYLVDYCVNNCIKSGPEIKKAVLIEEFGIPTCLQQATNSPSTLMVFNSDWKCRFIDIETMSPFRTVQGPSCGPVSLVQLLKLPDYSDEFMFFVANNEIGLMKLPIDGNPFKTVSNSAGSKKIISACVGNDGRTAFSLAQNEHIVMWGIEVEELNILEMIGGKGLEPFIKALNLDPTSPNINEMEAVFIISQLGSSKYTSEKPEILKDTIPLSVLPNFVRGLGFFPTNKEIKLMIDEVLEDENIKIEEKLISFETSLKLFYNHRCTRFSESQMKHSFENLCKRALRCHTNDKLTISLENFICFLEHNGDKFTSCQIYHYLKALISPLTKEDEWMILTRNKELEDIPEEHLKPNTMYDFIPEMITYEFFKNAMLGLLKDSNENETVTLTVDSIIDSTPKRK